MSETLIRGTPFRGNYSRGKEMKWPPMHICLAVEFFKDRFCKQELRWFEPLFQEIQLSEEREKCKERNWNKACCIHSFASRISVWYLTKYSVPSSVDKAVPSSGDCWCPVMSLNYFEKKAWCISFEQQKTMNFSQESERMDAVMLLSFSVFISF